GPEAIRHVGLQPRTQLLPEGVDRLARHAACLTGQPRPRRAGEGSRRRRLRAPGRPGSWGGPCPRRPPSSRPPPSSSPPPPRPPPPPPSPRPPRPSAL